MITVDTAASIWGIFMVSAINAFIVPATVPSAQGYTAQPRPYTRATMLCTPQVMPAMGAAIKVANRPRPINDKVGKSAMMGAAIAAEYTACAVATMPENRPLSIILAA